MKLFNADEYFSLTVAFNSSDKEYLNMLYSKHIDILLNAYENEILLKKNGILSKLISNIDPSSGTSECEITTVLSFDFSLVGRQDSMSPYSLFDGRDATWGQFAEENTFQCFCKSEDREGNRVSVSDFTIWKHTSFLNKLQDRLEVSHGCKMEFRIDSNVKRDRLLFKSENIVEYEHTLVLVCSF